MRRLTSLLLGLLAPLLLSAAPAATPSPRPSTPTQLPVGVEPIAYALTVTPDARALTFAGQVEITLQVARPTRRIVLNAADLDIDRASLDGGAAATVSLDAGEETASFAFARPVAAGRHVLSIAYRGKVNSRPAGLFKVDYDTAAGKSPAKTTGRVLMTQFEPADARRFLPVFDEPAKKATFAVTAVVPAADLALSNMPEASSEPLPGGLKRVRFAVTPRMASYLLFFGTGDFERITADVDGTRVGVVIKRGDGEKARYALQAATELLKYYNSYFGIRYPLPKLDLIAAPGDTGGAMENWGAIQFGQTAMVIDPKLSTDADRQEVYNTVAHEMAHQWFGDLVTMAWWDDLWLNEAFASWMASKATDHFHPEWKPLLWALSDKDQAMRLDARSATHPIVREIKTVAQSEQAFDLITYQKGEAVLRMLEAYAGEEPWREGVRAYMARHAYGSTVGDDLWSEMDRAARQPISAVAHDFTRQGGVPLVSRGGCGPGDGSLAVSRFSADAPPAAAAWRAPLIARPIGGGDRVALLLGGTDARLPPGSAEGCPAWLLNAGQSGYVRVAYPAAAQPGLAAALPKLDPADQIGLLNDANALGLAGDQPMAAFLDLAAALPVSADAVAWDTAVERLIALDAAHPNGPGRGAYRAWAIARLRPVLARLGYDRQPGEGANVGILRNTTISVLSRLGDSDVIAEARRRFEGFRRDPAGLSAGTRRWVLQAVARSADAATFDALRDMARTATDPLEKQRLYEALADVRDPALSVRMLDIAISEEVPANIGPDLVTQIGTEHPELAWRFALAHEAALAKNLDALSRTTFIPRIAAESADPRRIDDLQAWAEKTLPKDDRGEVEVAKARIRQAAAIERLRVPEVDAWVAARR